MSSNSPRRKELLAGLGVDFEVRVLKGVDERYPDDIPLNEVPLYIAIEKASAYTVAKDELVVTADTVVIVDNAILGKPKNRRPAQFYGYDRCGVQGVERQRDLLLH